MTPIHVCNRVARRPSSLLRDKRVGTRHDVIRILSQLQLPGVDRAKRCGALSPHLDTRKANRTRVHNPGARMARQGHRTSLTPDVSAILHSCTKQHLRIGADYACSSWGRSRAKIWPCCRSVASLSLTDNMSRLLASRLRGVTQPVILHSIPLGPALPPIDFNGRRLHHGVVDPVGLGKAMQPEAVAPPRCRRCPTRASSYTRPSRRKAYSIPASRRASATTAMRLPRRAARRSAHCHSRLPTIALRHTIRQAAPTNNARICPLPCLVIVPRCCC